jgi:CubicO group peptidase (beta-lactamase class C family)
MSSHTLSDFVAATATKLGIPGVAVGVLANGHDDIACHGTTSLENPLPVDPDTLFVLGSVSKTFTATTLMRLVGNGKVDLGAPVRNYVPELRLKDEQAASQITVLNLLNHTSGLDWGFTSDTGEGDDALARYVEKMNELELLAPPGARASYSQAGYNLIGRVIERVTGLSFERAVASLVFEPLGLKQSFFARDDVMTRRFSVGHNQDEDGTFAIARLWRRWRGENPGGGVVSSASDLLQWARFHLGDGRAENGERVLAAKLLERMQQPTVELRGSSLGDAIGICWFLRDVGGVRTISHGGSANGQFADLVLAPKRGFAAVALSNAFPEGPAFNKTVVKWALETYLGAREAELKPRPYDEARAHEVVGAYGNEVMTMDVTSDGTSILMDVRMKPRIREAADKELPPDYPPFEIGLAGDNDEYIVTSGGMKGLRGVFTRDESGAIVGLDLAGRLASRLPSPPTEPTLRKP